MRSVRSSSIAPGRPGDVVYLVLDDFGPIGKAYREAEPGEANEDAIIDNLISGQYSHPQRVVAFSLMEDFARDVTTEVALKVLKQAIAKGSCPRQLASYSSGRSMPTCRRKSGNQPHPHLAQGQEPEEPGDDADRGRGLVMG